MTDVEPDNPNQLSPDRTFAVLGIVIAIIAWIVVPNLAVKVFCFIVALSLSVWVIYSSQFTRHLPRLLKHILSAMVIVVMLFWGWMQFEQSPEAFGRSACGSPPSTGTTQGYGLGLGRGL
jgi:hypothetical protein